MMTLTNEQVELINAKAKIVVGCACPGSGKTVTLIQRAKARPNGKQLITTFTKKCKEEVAERLGDNFQVETLHGLAYKIIVTNWRKLGDILGSTNWPDHPLILTKEEEAVGIDILYGKSDYWNKLIQQMRPLSLQPSDVMNLYNKGVYIKGYKKEDIHNFYNYEINRLSQGILVMDNLIPLANRLLMSPEINHGFYDQYDCVLVDEAQDLSSQQWQLLEPFLLGRQELFIIGDLNQSIFGYAGGNGLVFGQLMNHPDSQVFPLSYNFRSGRRIVELANSLKPVGMISSKNIEGVVSLFAGKSIYEEAEFIKQNLKQGSLVLARTNKYLEEIEPFLPGFQLMTIHQSKGKEYDHVAIVGCNAGILPNPMNSNQSEEENLFYVACSRAKIRLIVSHSGKPSSYFNFLTKDYIIHQLDTSLTYPLTQ